MTDISTDQDTRVAGWRLLLGNPVTLISAVVLAAAVATALAARRIAPSGVNDVDVPNALQPPGGAHWFGTDELGRDVFSRVLVAIQASLQVAVVSVGLRIGARRAASVWWPATAAAGWTRWSMRGVDVMFAFPVLLLALAIVAVLGPGVGTTMLAIGIVYTPIFARVARAATLSVRVEPFVQVSRTMGTPHRAILSRHVLPNIAGPLIVQTSLSLAFAILSEAALSFLGLGIQPPQPSLGRMIFDSQGFVTLAWWIAVFPGAAIVVIVVALNLLGDGLRDVLDPKQRTLVRNQEKPVSGPVLSVQELSVRIGPRDIVRDISFDVEPKQTLGIVGESGSGKTMTALAATGLLDTPGALVSGSSTIAAQGDSPRTELVGASARVLRSVHGSRVGFVFQDPGTSLNPLLTLERQITESLEAHRDLSRRQARARATELLDAVGLPDPAARLGSYPHQLSGGQRQRVMVAIALACDPELLVADEPTTALDVTTQAQIVELIRTLQRDFGTAVVWISHDLGLIGQVADEVTVLQSGAAVEQAPIDAVFERPQHAYTRQLLDARPLIGGGGPEPAPADAPVLLRVDGLDVRFTVTSPAGTTTTVHAVDDVSFGVRRGTTLGLVGESGSGKSTVAGALTGLVRPHSGTATLDGVDMFAVRGAAEKALRRRVSLVLQDPFSALDPRARIGAAIAEPLRVHHLCQGRRGRAARVAELLDLVGLPAAFASRYPHELSGGQRQRVSIARALAVEPDLVILDEATASLDVSVQARVLELLAGLQRDLGLTYLFIAHDLAVIEQVSHDVLVMKDGAALEYRAAADLLSAPEHEYTRTLLAAVPPARPRVG